MKTTMKMKKNKKAKNKVRPSLQPQDHSCIVEWNDGKSLDGKKHLSSIPSLQRI